MSNKKIEDYSYQQYINRYNDFSNIKIENDYEKKTQEEYEKFKAKLRAFNNIGTIMEAKTLAKRLFNIQNEENYIKAGNGFCTIINQAHTFRIVLNSEKEVICYNFNTMEEK